MSGLILLRCVLLTSCVRPALLWREIEEGWILGRVEVGRVVGEGEGEGNWLGYTVWEKNFLKMFTLTGSHGEGRNDIDHLLSFYSGNKKKFKVCVIEKIESVSLHLWGHRITQSYLMAVCWLQSLPKKETSVVWMQSVLQRLMCLDTCSLIGEVVESWKGGALREEVGLGGQREGFLMASSFLSMAALWPASLLLMVPCLPRHYRMSSLNCEPE